MPEPQIDQQEEVLTLAEAAAFLRVSEDALLTLADRDAIPAQKIGEEWRFLKRALADWLQYGRHYGECRRCPPWLCELPLLEELALLLEKRLPSRQTIPTDEREAPGSKEAVLKHFGVFRDDSDLANRLEDASKRRKAGG